VSVREFARKVFRGQWPILVVGLFFLAAFILVIASYWRRGAVVLGVGVAVASVLRLALPDERAGLLAVRSKGLDFITTAAVSAAVLYIAWTIDPLGTS
jgi:hypothetical protein